MKRVQRTDEEKEALEFRHHYCLDSKEIDRIQAVLLRLAGWTFPIFSQSLHIQETTMTRHINDYREGKLKL